MEADMSAVTSTGARRGLAPLGKLTIAALAAILAIIVAVSFVLGEGLDSFTLVLGAIVLVAGGAVAIGWRWTPALAGVLSTLLFLAMVLFLSPSLAYPQDPDFILAVLLMALPLLAAISGFGATIQNYRGGDRRMPGWLIFGFTAFGGLVIGVIALSLVVDKSTEVRVSPEVLEGLPAVRVHEFDFTRKEIRVKAGEMVALRLDNDDASLHSFDVDELDVHVPMFREQASMALFRPTEPGRYTFYCSIPGHADLENGTGMIGTLVVES
jgi:uncharacterized cupredoxin-like copper-binding protein